MFAEQPSFLYAVIILRRTFRGALLDLVVALARSTFGPGTLAAPA